MSKPVGTISICEVIKHSSGNIVIGIDPGLQNFGIGILSIDPEAFVAETPEFIIDPNSKRKRKIKKKELEKQALASEVLGNFVLGYSYGFLKIKQNRGIEEKLAFIFDFLCGLFLEYKPKLVVVEDSFVGINKNSALKLGLVRGCVLTSVGKFGASLKTIPPRQIKMEVSGKGDSEKEAIQEVFKNIFKKWPEEGMVLDSSDAIAAAFCGIKFLIRRK